MGLALAVEGFVKGGHLVRGSLAVKTPSGSFHHPVQQALDRCLEVLATCTIDLVAEALVIVAMDSVVWVR